ncbi:unnamed protein product, partial [Choristocarpus tenellus]
RYTYKLDAHSSDIVGDFGAYGSGAFIQELPWKNQTEAESILTSLEDTSWVDKSTRAITLEVAMHSLSAKKFTYVQLLIELPGGGGLPAMSQLYVTFNGFNSYSAVR